VDRGTGVLRRTGIDIRRFGAAEGMPQAEVRVILEDRDGSIWFGTDGGGVGRIRGDRVEALTTANGLPEDRVRAMYEDREGGLWVGTVESGTVRLRDGSATTFGRTKRRKPSSGPCSRIGRGAFSSASKPPVLSSGRRTAGSRPIRRSSRCARPASGRCSTTAGKGC
jgi:ligand-binding sensor domain-containing protein